MQLGIWPYRLLPAIIRGVFFPVSLVKSVATIGSYTLISRVFGFLRDVLIASILGASTATDAFFVAFKLPNFMRRLFAEGAFNSAFIPMFSSMLVGEGKEKALEFAKEVKSVLTLILLIITLLAELFMPQLVSILAPGFSDNPEKFALTVDLTRITFPYLFMISLVSLYGGLLNSINRFAAVAATPILMNISLIFSLLVLRYFTPTPAHALSIGVLISGLAQLFWLMHFCYRHQFLPRPSFPRLTPNVKKLLILIGPAALGAGVAQVNLMIDTIIASHIDQGVSYLYYADRIAELPLGVIGIAVGTALLPMLSRFLREGRHEDAVRSLNRAVEMAMLMGFPAAVALMVIAEPVVNTLYLRGAFTLRDSVATHLALMAFAGGLPSFVLIKVFAPVFFAHHNTKTPVKIAICCVILNLILNLMLMKPFSHVGLAMATSISGWVNAAALGWILYKNNAFAPDELVKRRLAGIVAASVAMAVILLLLQWQLTPWFALGLEMKILGLAILVSSGFFCYSALVISLKVVSKQQLLGYIKRK